MPGWAWLIVAGVVLGLMCLILPPAVDAAVAVIGGLIGLIGDLVAGLFGGGRK